VKNKLPTDTLPLHASIMLLIGPEGGLTDHEIKVAIQHGFLPLNLGPRVLRTETAPLAALSILQYCYGDG
jgi:16S rRNA (uracil1498-N3)-methyltransferase